MKGNKNMDWKEEMKMGMLMIQSACQKNHSWCDCHECPFNDFCDYIFNEIFQTPDDWNLESED